MPGWKTRYPGVESLNVAIMGCIVNGPGESKHADIGISLPAPGETPAAPVFVDGKKFRTLRAPTSLPNSSDGDRLYRPALRRGANVPASTVTARSNVASASASVARMERQRSPGQPCAPIGRSRIARSYPWARRRRDPRLHPGYHADKMLSPGRTAMSSLASKQGPAIGTSPMTPRLTRPSMSRS